MVKILFDWFGGYLCNYYWVMIDVGYLIEFWWVIMFKFVYDFGFIYVCVVID